MAQRKIQLLRSQTIYTDIDAARTSINNTFATTAGLSDGELVLARYYATESSIGGGPKTVVRSLLGIYNSKDSSHPGFTYITNEKEINSITDNINDRLSTIEQSIDALDLNSPIGGSTGTAVTEIDQQNGQVSGTATAVEDLTLDGYTKTNDTGDIDAGDSLEVAFSKLENAIDTVDVDIHSTDETITVTPDTTGKNLEVNIDGQSIVQDPTTKKLKTNLQISKITTGLEANVKEAYRLQDSGGNIYGQQINVYKDSALKEVFIGTVYDTVDSQTGEVRKITYEARTALIFLDENGYDSLSEIEKPLYEEGERNVYTVNNPTLTSEEYSELTSDVKSMYAYNEETSLWAITTDYSAMNDDKYENLTPSQKAQYTITTEPGYVIVNRYITEDEFNEIYGDNTQQNTVYKIIGGSDYYGQIPVDALQSLNFVYYLSDGTYEIVKVDFTKFIVQSEFGDGLESDSGKVSVRAGNGLGFGGAMVGRKPLIVIADPNSMITVTETGVAIDESALERKIERVASDNQLIDAVDNTSSVNMTITNVNDVKTLTSDVNIDYTSPSTASDHTYAASNGNVLQIKNGGLYLDSTWDCGEY